MFRLLSQIKFGNISKKCLDKPGLVCSTFAILFNMPLFKYIKITFIAKWGEMAIDFPCLYKKKKHGIMKKYLLIISSFSKFKQKSLI